jgi:hypothetical protein
MMLSFTGEVESFLVLQAAEDAVTCTAAVTPHSTFDTSTCSSSSCLQILHAVGLDQHLEAMPAGDTLAQ